MKVSEIMTRNPVCITRLTTLQEAARKMDEMDCGFLIVGTDDELEGVITDRDIVTRAVAKGNSPQHIMAGEVMTHHVLYCFENDDLHHAAGRMKEGQVYRLAVLNNSWEKRLSGVITLGDISRKAHDERLVGETAEQVAKRVA